MADSGKVYLVGAGPGDPGLITIRGRDVLASADVVVYDFLANPSLLNHCQKNCEHVYVGKKSGQHTMKQEEINRLIVDLASAGNTVVRLKGGDPFIFGRGGEEALALSESGIDFEIVPGITAGIAAAAYAGIPLTQRSIAASTTFVTGHEDPDKKISDLNWNELGQSKTTLVFYMGVRNIDRIATRLIDHGRDSATPAALIRWGTLPSQQTIEGTLESIVELARETGIEPPAVLVVGDVVRLRKNLRWFDRRVLFGRRILVTRSRSQNSSLAAALLGLGADVKELPTIAIKPLDDYSELDSVLRHLEEYTWVIFTSQNAVESVFERVRIIGMDARSFAGLSVAAVGTETARVLSQRGICPDLIPVRQSADGLAEFFRSEESDLADRSMLFPCSDIAPEALTHELSGLGAKVDQVVAYRTARPTLTMEEIEKCISPKPDMLTFTSSSTVKNLLEILERSGCAHAFDGVPTACIGPVTAETANRGGFQVVFEAAPHTIDALVHGIKDYFDGKEKA